MTQDQDRRKGELIDFMAAAARRGKKPAESAPSVSIKGNGNIVGNHNQVRVTVHTRPATRVTVAPGPEHITPAQAADIRDLVDRLVKRQGHTRRSGTPSNAASASPATTSHPPHSFQRSKPTWSHG